MIAVRSLRREDCVGGDFVLVTLALMHGCLLLLWPSIPVIALGVWWNANTVSHNFIHRPFFRTRALNAGFSCFLSLLLGLPQSLWRARHLAHHLAQEGRHKERRFEVAPGDVVAATTLWLSLAVFAARFTLTIYLPGFLMGLALCYLQGHYEHSRGTVSHYGTLYNFVFFNDGFHVEHHARPGAHWSELPQLSANLRAARGNTSRWPAVLRWLECVNLCALERLVLRSRTLQRFVLDRHERALRRLPIDLQSISTVGIVGGGLFPRTAIILSRLLPCASLTIIDMDVDNVALSRGFVKSNVEYRVDRFDATATCEFDLLVIPLAFVGDRSSLYNRPPAGTVLVHDWVWCFRGTSVVVSWLLLKRLNLVTR